MNQRKRTNLLIILLGLLVLAIIGIAATSGNDPETAPVVTQTQNAPVESEVDPIATPEQICQMSAEKTEGEVTQYLVDTLGTDKVTAREMKNNFYLSACPERALQEGNNG